MYKMYKCINVQKTKYISHLAVEIILIQTFFQYLDNASQDKSQPKWLGNKLSDCPWCHAGGSCDIGVLHENFFNGNFGVSITKVSILTQFFDGSFFSGDHGDQESDGK